MNGGPIYECGDIRLDAGRMVVTRSGEVVELEPKAFDVLRFLIEHRDRLATKDELLDVVWGDTFVTPNVLTRAIAQIRKAIGDDAHESKYIETVAAIDSSRPLRTERRSLLVPRQLALSFRKRQHGRPSRQR